MQLIDNQNRAKLSEGRSWGLGFAFCKKNPDASFETTMPLTSCRDFLNDVVFSEQTGKPFNIYGLSTQKLGIFTDGFAYMALSVLPYNRGAKVANHDVLNESFMRGEWVTPIWMVENAIGIDIQKRSGLRFAQGDVYVFRLPDFWVRYTYLISLWSLLARVGLEFKGEDPMEFIRQQAKTHPYDATMLTAALPKIERIMAGEIPEQDLVNLRDVHNCGIVNFKFPTK